VTGTAWQPKISLFITQENPRIALSGRFELMAHCSQIFLGTGFFSSTNRNRDFAKLGPFGADGELSRISISALYQARRSVRIFGARLPCRKASSNAGDGRAEKPKIALGGGEKRHREHVM